MEERGVDDVVREFADEIREIVCRFREDCNAYLDAFCEKYGFPKDLALYCLLLLMKDDQLKKDTKED